MGLGNGKGLGEHLLVHCDLWPFHLKADRACPCQHELHGKAVRALGSGEGMLVSA
jgi:hypothetical protein